MQNAIKLENIRNLIASLSSYQCRKTNVNMKRDICDILFGVPDDISVPHSTALEWLVKLDKQLKSDDVLSTKGDNNFDMVIPNLMRLLRECLSTHRWSQLVPVVQQFSKHDYATFCKTSMEVMYASESSHQLVQQLVKELKTVVNLNCQEILMEYLMFLLHNGKLDDAKQVTQDVRKSLRKATPRDVHIDILFKAYQSLVWYVEWAATKVKVEHMDKDNDLLNNLEEIMAIYAQKAMLGFNNVAGETGVWDIFVTKYVEILEYYNKITEAKDILIQYRDKNTENLNAHKYIYYFSVRNEVLKEEELLLLTNIAESSPSDSLVLQLCHKLVTDERVPVALTYLFTLLDYVCWQNDIKPWKLLLDLIEGNKERTDVQNTIKDNWKMRKSWWPQYHFNGYNCPQNGEECQLCFCKAKLAVQILGQDFQKVIENFSHLSKPQIKNLKRTEYKIT